MKSWTSSDELAAALEDFARARRAHAAGFARLQRIADGMRVEIHPITREPAAPAPGTLGAGDEQFWREMGAADFEAGWKAPPLKLKGQCLAWWVEGRDSQAKPPVITPAPGFDGRARGSGDDLPSDVEPEGCALCGRPESGDFTR